MQTCSERWALRGDQAELRRASDEFGGHCLALTLLGSYLTDAYDGDIRCRKEVSEHLSHDVRQGVSCAKSNGILPELGLERAPSYRFSAC